MDGRMHGWVLMYLQNFRNPQSPHPPHDGAGNCDETFILPMYVCYVGLLATGLMGLLGPFFA